MGEGNNATTQSQAQTQAGQAQAQQGQGQATMMNNGMGEAPAYAGQQQGAEQGGYQAQAQHQQSHGGHGQGGQADMQGGYPPYYCAPAPAAPQHPGAMPPPGMYAQPAPAYPPQPAPPMGGYPHPGYMPMPQQPQMQQPHNPAYAQAQPPAYGYAPAAGQPYPYAAQEQAHDNGLSSFFNFRDERFIKGAVTGAALTFLLTNESLQKNTLKSVVKFWNMLQGGVEEMKERIQDIDAEIKAEDQPK